MKIVAWELFKPDHIIANKNVTKRNKADEKAARHIEGQVGGIDNFVTQRQAIFKTDTKKFQKGVKFSPNGQRVACAGSDG